MLAMLVRRTHGVALGSRSPRWLCSLDIGFPVATARATALCPMETGLAFYPQTLHTKESSNVSPK